MRAIYRRAAVLAASGVLIFFCSCERHKADELAHGEHAEASPAAHDAQKHDGEASQHAADHNASPASSPMGMPAQFFPSPTPR